jgi:eukaryotic-like serine/threonine-protein kinase
LGESSKIPEITQGPPAQPAAGTIYEFDPFRLNPRDRTLLRGAEVVSLTAKVFDTLVLLVQNSGRLLPKDELMKALWPDSFVEEVNLSQNISVLRKALGESAQHPHYIVTVPGRGYRFAPAVTVTSPGALVQSTEGLPVFKPQEQGIWHRAGRSRWLVALIGTIATLALAVTALRRSPPTRPNLSPEKTRVTRITESGKAPNAAISPDGQYVAYIEVDGDQYSLWRKQITTGGTTQVVPRGVPVLTHVTFGPDGNYLYFTRTSLEQRDVALVRVPALGGPELLIHRNVDTPISFSPDGRQFAFMRGAPRGESQIVIGDTDGGGVERILASRTTPLSFSYVGPAWSPDGRTVAAAAADHSEGRRWSVQVISVQDGNTSELFTSDRIIGRVRWRPDGSGLLTVLSETLATHFPSWQAGNGSASHVSGGAIWHITYPDGAAERLTSDLIDYDICCLDLSADGTSITSVHNSVVSDLWIAAVNNLENPRQVTWGAPVFRRHAWLADNRTIVYRDLNGKLTSIRRDGSAGAGFTPDLHTIVGGVSACGDGRHVVLQSTRSNGIWRIDPDGSNATRLTSGHLDSGPACSGDGRRVLYTSVRSGVPSTWQVSIDGGAPAQLIAEHSLEVLPSPSGRLTYYFAVEAPREGAGTRMKWVVLSSQTGKRLYTFDKPLNAALGIGPVWAPDESGLDYVLTTAGVSNIWRQPLSGGSPLQITHYTTGKIFSLAWSPDGRWLSLASGLNRSDVVLISTSR